MGALRLPDYGRRCIDTVVPALLSLPGADRAMLPEAAVAARQCVLLLLDGLGWEQFEEHRARLPNLASLDGGPVTSVAPTTTATALASVVLGCPPARHGILGYRMRVETESGEDVLNVLRWRTSGGDARQAVPPAAIQARLAFGGRPVPAVTRSEFAGSGFTTAHLAGSRVVGWSLPSSLPVEVAALIASGEPLVYAYYDGIDKAAHLFGFDERYRAELRAADRLVGDILALLPAGTALVVTADHGQIEVGSRAHPLAPEVAGLTALLSGEARFRWLHAGTGEGAADELLEAAHRCYDDDFWVLPAHEVESSGWWGGPLEPASRRRLGDVAVVARGAGGILDPADGGEARLVCRHGALTSAELMVPLLGGRVGPG